VKCPIFCPISKKFLLFIEIFIEVFSIKFCANLSRGSVADVCEEQDRETERETEGLEPNRRFSLHCYIRLKVDLKRW
jgi:hypothetical protein